jgi:chemotaxis protein methyltransferase CheR
VIGSRATPQDFAFTDADFQAIADLARGWFGLNLEPAKKQLVYARLARRLRALGIASFADYRALLGDAAGHAERRHMLSALTTNVTQFFRERHHFDDLAANVLSGLVARAASGGRARLWSAGCSAGQEAYSLALTILALRSDLARHDLRILATDIDPAILARALRGRYPSSERAAIPGRLHRWLEEDEGGGFSIGPAARGLIQFGELNLVADWPMRGPFDVILCRNVAIYFDAQTQARLWQRLAQALAPGGLLMIGHSERVLGPAADMLVPRGVTTYVKAPPIPTARPMKEPGR